MRRAHDRLSIPLITGLGAAALLASMVVSIGFGAVDIPPSTVISVLGARLGQLLSPVLPGLLTGEGEALLRTTTADIILSIRLPRVVLGAAVGAGLSLAGVVMQAIVRNPLANPYILGVSSGATFGAAASILLGAYTLAGGLGTAAGAFLGALAASVFVFCVAFSGQGRGNTVKLLLAGTAVNAICSSFTNFLVYTAQDAEGIRSVTFWSMGSLTSADWGAVPLPLGTAAAAGLFFFTQCRPLNVLLTGEESAVILGVDAVRLRQVYMLLAACVTGVAVAAAGTIGFVGLIVPHVARILVGTDHRRMLPLSVLGGGVFLVWCDVFARIYLDNVELPIGIVTGIIGGPFFIYLMLTKRYGFGGG